MELSASLHNYQAMDGRIVRAIANQVVVLPSLVGADYERIRGEVKLETPHVLVVVVQYFLQILLQVFEGGIEKFRVIAKQASGFTTFQ